MKLYNYWKDHKRLTRDNNVGPLLSDQIIQSQAADQVNGTENCLKCERNGEINVFNTAIQELQIRSADESMSIFVICFTCGTRR